MCKFFGPGHYLIVLESSYNLNTDKKNIMLELLMNYPTRTLLLFNMFHIRNKGVIFH